jgi:hypothetical protein
MRARWQKTREERLAGGRYTVTLEPERRKLVIRFSAGALVAGLLLGSPVTALVSRRRRATAPRAVAGVLFYQQPIRPIHVLGMVLLAAGTYRMGVGNAAP